jgi:cyclase
VNARIVARLDIKGPNLVKGIHLEGLRALGRPEDFARHYYETGADELFYQDAVASLYGRNSLLDMIEKTSREIFIPLTVGGGLRSLEDIRKVLLAGADKVALNTAAVADPGLIAAAARRFGSSTIVVSVEAKRMPDGTYQAFTDNGREPTGKDAVAWAREAVGLGAGEVLLTSIDQEGTGAGFDLNLIRQVAEKVACPVIASGGAGRLDHVAEALDRGGADGVALASLLHYARLGAAGAGAGASEGNFEFIRQGRAFTKISPCSLVEVKGSLGGYAMRPCPGTGSGPAAPGAPVTVAIVDYGLGNLFSVRQACEQVGMRPVVTDDPQAVLAADGVILPGVGAFGDAMEALRQRGLDAALRRVVAQKKPLLGICLGMQLLLDQSCEFGHHAGLGLVPGRVESLGEPEEAGRRLKIPHTGWNAVVAAARPWSGTPLLDTAPGEPMYFVHSFRTVPASPEAVLGRTRYGGVTFCSALASGTVWGLQFHPERSGREGLKIYAAFGRLAAGTCREGI